MKEEDSIILKEAALDLTRYEKLNANKQAVARWLASPVIEPGRKRPSLSSYAEQNGIDKRYAYRLAQDDDVIEAARDLIRDSVQAEKVPILWQVVFNKAMRSPDFALKVLKQLDSMGFDVLMGEKNEHKAAPNNQTINIYAPGGLESAIIAMRKGTDAFADASEAEND